MPSFGFMAPLNRREFQRLADLRLQEADSLLKNKHPSGAYYLAGYAVECALKACIAKQTKRYEFPDRRKVQQSWTHKLDELVNLTGLAADLVKDADLETNWTTVKDWNEEKRYETTTLREARDLYAAITDPKHGVLTWLRKHW